MDHKQWIYQVNGKEIGPVSQEEIQSLVESKQIGPQTLISRKGSHVWKTLEEESVFSGGDIDQKEPVIREKQIESNHLLQQDLSLDNPHPWHRFWARMLDYSIFGFVLSYFFRFFLSLPYLHPLSIGMGVLFLWVFIEAILISSWHTTIGKWLFNIQVEKKDGSKITYSDALSRSFSVWWLGLAAGLPIIYIVTLIVACVKLSSTRSTTWDKRGFFVVKHKKLSWWRIVIIVVLYCFFGYMFFMTNLRLISYSQALLIEGSAWKYMF